MGPLESLRDRKDKVVGVYKITSPSGKVYVGSSIDILKRFNQYRLLSCNKQRRLFNSLKKHGYEAHAFEILLECSTDELYDNERHYGDLYDVLGSKGLNCKLPKSSDKKAITEESTKRKISTRISEYHRQMTPHQRAQLREKMREGRKRIPLLRYKEMAVHKKKLILNIETGIFYLGAAEASEAACINKSSLINQLCGDSGRKNKTPLRYV